MDFPLQPRSLNHTSDEILNRFLAYVERKNLQLYSAQEEAILDLLDEKNVILNTPTGSGKSLVAAFLHFHALCRGRRSVYTCPIKALVNEKFLSLCKDFGPENVGMATGDATVNREAPILCCTAEILSNMALREGANCPIGDVVMDEFHYYSDKERGVAWQVPLLTMSRSRFLLMSATFGDPSFFQNELSRLNQRETTVVRSTKRPVPLEFEYDEMPLEQTVEKLSVEKRAPVYIVHFTQLECAETAQNLLSQNLATREEKSEIASALEGYKFSSPYGSEIKKFLRHGIGIHHAGLLPKYRVIVELLAQKGLLKVICGTDTLGVGVNVPIRTVVLTRLSKYNGEKVALLSARDFHQITGRAGRKGFDDQGWVVCQAPEHVIENARLERKTAGDPKKAKKVVKKKPPEGFVGWSKETFLRLVNASPEPLVSRFQVNHGMLLNVLSRPGDGCRDMQRLVARCHESPQAKKQLRSRAFELFRSLLDRKIIELSSDRQNGSRLRINVELPDDFSLDHTLALYLLDTIKLLEAEDPNYPLDLLTLVESIVENPEFILRRQLDRVRSEKIAQLKMEGVPFEERMLELENLEYPKPRREFIYSTFNEFAARHPWVGQENIRPKSIVREMVENCYSFADYVRKYELEKVEGLLLRHLMNVYKVLDHTVPPSTKSESVSEIELFLRTSIKQVDASLLEEWEKLRDPNYVAAESKELKPSAALSLAQDVTRNEKAFTALVRTNVFSILRALAIRKPEAALITLDDTTDEGDQEWTASRLEGVVTEYLKGHAWISLDAEARNMRHTYIKPSEDRKRLLIQQTVLDPDGHNDWSLDLQVDLEKSRELERPHLKLLRLGPIAA